MAIIKGNSTFFSINVVVTYDGGGGDLKMMWAGWDKYIGNYIIVFHSFPGNILSSAVFFNYNNVYFYTFRKHKAK